MSLCTKCGRELDDSQLFCPNCATPIPNVSNNTQISKSQVKTVDVFTRIKDNLVEHKSQYKKRNNQ